MAPGPRDRNQLPLPFADAEASERERWNTVNIALARIGRRCDLTMKDFVHWVYRATAGGTHGRLQRSYARLAERPTGLCCSARKIRSTIELAERLGLVTIHACRRADGSQQDNAYSIDWEGIRRIIQGSHQWGPHGVSCHPPGTTCQGHGVSCHHIKEQELPAEEVSDTGPEAVPNPKWDLHTARVEDRPRTAVLDAPAGLRLGAAPRSTMDLLLAQSPILMAAAGRRIEPLPAGCLVHGVFGPIEGRHLYKPLSFVHWHRRQLATAVPVMGDTEADLLMTLATVLYATSLGEADVQKNRVAVFVNTIMRRRFLRALPSIPKARSLLDRGIERMGRPWAGLEGEA